MIDYVLTRRVARGAVLAVQGAHRYRLWARGWHGVSVVGSLRCAWLGEAHLGRALIYGGGETGESDSHLQLCAATSCPLPTFSHPSWTAPQLLLTRTSLFPPSVPDSGRTIRALSSLAPSTPSLVRARPVNTVRFNCSHSSLLSSAILQTLANAERLRQCHHTSTVLWTAMANYIRHLSLHGLGVIQYEAGNWPGSHQRH